MSLKRKIFKSVLTLSTDRNILQHLFHGKSLLNLWRWVLLLSCLALTTSCIIRSTGLHGIIPSTTPCQYFVGYYESKPFQTTSKPNMYYRYMDDTFVVFSNEDECNLFLNNLNSLLFALVLKKNLTWLFLSWTCCLKNLFPSLSPPTTGNLHSSVNTG